MVHQLHLDVPPADLTEWKQVVSRIATRSKTCTIALVGKYVKLHDAYLSVMESLYHAGFENDSQVEIRWVESEDLTDQAACKEAFADVDGIIVPGGFGDRGIEGMIQAAQYARENRVPCFGICLGMQIMVIEFARNVLGYKDANSSEFTPDGAHNVISLMPDQQGNIPKGGTMRLGKYPCTVAPGTKMAECYGRRCRTPGWSSPALARTAIWWRLWSCPAATSIWVHSSTRSSRAAPTAHIPCSRALSPLRCATALPPSGICCICNSII